MPLTRQASAMQASDVTNKSTTDNARDPLGLTPLPIDSRQRYLRFILSQKREVLIPLFNILEVMQLAFEDILPVPNMPSCVLGVCGWQSEALWLVDLNSMVGDRPLLQQPTNAVALTIIVVQTQEKSLGLVVEGVSDINLFDPAHIRMEKGLCPPSLEPYVLGYCPDRADIVLDVSKIIHSPLLQSHSS